MIELLMRLERRSEGAKTRSNIAMRLQLDASSCFVPSDDNRDALGGRHVAVVE
jgi:hypothetical protein